MSRPIRTPRDPSYLRDLFTRSARFYDSVNSAISLGQVKAWRRETVELAHLKADDRVLDAFSGPGGLAEQALPVLGRGGEVVLVDLSPVMLHEARRRLCPRVPPGDPEGPAVRFVAGDLLREELALGSFDVVLLGWGLRYVPDVGVALRRVWSLLRPGGRLAVLEFTRPRGWTWATPAHLYFRHVLPRVAARLAGDRELHEYLLSSSAGFLDAAGLVRAFRDQGFVVQVARGHFGGQVTIVVAGRGDDVREAHEGVGTDGA